MKYKRPYKKQVSQKETKPIPKKQSVKNPPENKIKTFFEEFIAPYSIWVLIGLIVLIGLLAFKKYLFGDSLFFFTDIGSDSVTQIYPSIIHKINLLQEGFISKWSFYRGMGEPYYSAFPVEPLSVFRNILTNLFVSVFGANYYIFGKFALIFIFHFLLSGIVFYYYLRTISIKKFSSIIGAMLITFSGFIVAGSSWAFSGQVFMGVFLLFAFEQLFVKKRWFFFPFAIIFISNNPFIFYIFSLFLVLYTIFRFTSEQKGGLKEFLKLTGQMILLGLTGVLMNAVKIVKTFMTLFFSPRVAGNASYSQAISSGENLIDNSKYVGTTILRFFSNDIIGCGNDFAGWKNYFEAPMFYIGLLSLIILPQIFIYLNKRNKIIFGSFLGFWVLTLAFPYMRKAMLAFTGDYFRFGFDFFIPFVFLFFGISALNKLDEKFKINIPLLIGTVIFLLIILFIPYGFEPIDFDNKIRKIVVVFMLFYSFLLYVMTLKKYKSFAQIGLILLIVSELAFFSYNSYKDREPIDSKEFVINQMGYGDGTIQAIEYIKKQDASLFYRIEKDYQSGNAIHSSLNDAQAQSYYGTTNYSSFNQLNYIRFLEEIELIQKGDETATRWSRGLRGNPLLETFGNIKYHLSKDEKPFFTQSGFDSIAEINGVKILKNKYYLPLGYTYDKYVKLEDLQQNIKYMITTNSVETIKLVLLKKGADQMSIENIINKLIPIANKEFQTKTEFNTALDNIFPDKQNDELKFLILKHSVNNFRVQVALLNAFVYEPEHNPNIDISKFEQIMPTDTSVFIPVSGFNFYKYSSFINKLREDTLQIEKFSQSKITGTINMSAQKMLFLTIPFDKGWKIKVNGEEKELSRVNIGFSGIVLPEGEHKIELYYVPQYSRITSVISIISIILFWGFLIFYFVKKKIWKK